MKMRQIWLSLAATACLSGSLLPAAVVEEFLFNDAEGTEIENTVNHAGTGHMWDTDADLVGVSTNGAGQYNASLKSNVEFGSVYVDNDPDITAGTVYGVMELTWDFDPTSLDTAENEEIRLSLIDEDPRSTFVTAEFEIERTDENEVIIFGNAIGDGSVDTSTDVINMMQLTTFIAVLAVDLDNDRMQVHYSEDGGASFTSLTEGVLSPTRDVNSIRMVLSNDLSQDNVLIDRVALTTSNPFPGQIPSIPEPSSVLLAALTLLASIQALRR